MAQYTFNVVDGLADRGPDSVELRTVDDARKHLVQFASEILRDHPDLIWKGDLQVQVVNEQGFILFSIIAVGIKAPIVGQT